MAIRHVTEIPWEELTPDELLNDEREIVVRAIDAFRHSYAPHSGFRVGAAVSCKDGSIYEGQNIENYCFSPTVHAEEVACHHANADGKGDQIIKLACIVEQNGPRHIAPCGGCLVCMAQYEHRVRQPMIILFGGHGEKTVARVVGTRTLMPLSFVPSDLEK